MRTQEKKMNLIRLQRSRGERAILGARHLFINIAIPQIIDGAACTAHDQGTRACCIQQYEHTHVVGFGELLPPQQIIPIKGNKTSQGNESISQY